MKPTRFVFITALLLAIATAAGCGGRGTSPVTGTPDNTNKEQSVWLLEDNAEGKLVPYTGSELSLELKPSGDGFEAVVKLNTKEEILAKTFLLGYDWENVSFREAKKGDFFGAEEDTLLATMPPSPDFLAFFVATDLAHSEPFTGSGELMTAVFAGEPYRETADENTHRYEVGPAPSMASAVVFGDDFTRDIEITIKEDLQWDANKDGIVDYRDLPVLGVNFLDNENDWDECGNLNGDHIVNGLDVFLISTRWETGISAYRTERKETGGRSGDWEVQSDTERGWYQEAGGVGVGDERDPPGDECHPTITLTDTYDPQEVQRIYADSGSWPTYKYRVRPIWQLQEEPGDPNLENPLLDNLQIDLGDVPVVDYITFTTSSGTDVVDDEDEYLPEVITVNVYFTDTDDDATDGEHWLQWRVNDIVTIEQKGDPAGSDDIVDWNLVGGDQFRATFEWSPSKDEDIYVQAQILDRRCNAGALDKIVDIDGEIVPPEIDCLDTYWAVEDDTVITITGDYFNSSTAAVFLKPEEGGWLPQTVNSKTTTAIEFAVDNAPDEGLYNVIVRNVGTPSYDSLENIQIHVIDKPAEVDSFLDGQDSSVNNGDITTDCSDIMVVVDAGTECLRTWTGVTYNAAPTYQPTYVISKWATGSAIADWDFSQSGVGATGNLYDVNVAMDGSYMITSSGQYIARYYYNSGWTVVNNWDPLDMEDIGSFPTGGTIIDICEEYDPTYGAQTIYVLASDYNVYMLDTSGNLQTGRARNPVSVQDSGYETPTSIDVYAGNGNMYVTTGVYDPDNDSVILSRVWEYLASGGYTSSNWSMEELNEDWQYVHCIDTHNVVLVGANGESSHHGKGFAIYPPDDDKIDDFDPPTGFGGDDRADIRGLAEATWTIPGAGFNFWRDAIISRNDVLTDYSSVRALHAHKANLSYDYSSVDADYDTSVTWNPYNFLDEDNDFPLIWLDDPLGITFGSPLGDNSVFISNDDPTHIVEWDPMFGEYGWFSFGTSEMLSLTEYDSGSANYLYGLTDATSKLISYRNITTVGNPDTFGDRPTGSWTISDNIDIAYDDSATTAPGMVVLFSDTTNDYAVLARYENNADTPTASGYYAIGSNEVPTAVDVRDDGTIYFAVYDTSARTSRIIYTSNLSTFTAMTLPTLDSIDLADGKITDLAVVEMTVGGEESDVLFVSEEEETDIWMLSLVDSCPDPGTVITKFGDAELTLAQRMDAVGYPFEIAVIDSDGSNTEIIRFKGGD